MLEGKCISVTWIPLLTLRVNLQLSGIWAVKKTPKPMIWGNKKCEAKQNTRFQKASHRQLLYWGSSEENACLLSSVSLSQEGRKKERKICIWRLSSALQRISVSLASECCWVEQTCLVIRVQRRPYLIPKQGDPPATKLYNYGAGCPKHRNPCQVVILVEHNSPALCGNTAKRLGVWRAVWRCNVYT